MDLKAVRRGQFKVKTTELAERGGGGGRVTNIRGIKNRFTI